ncbi:hypothetical protein QFC19_009091 [Naganishia cerealis]|uniref:Uncharacterized protein n=1 Tax=Naganishia cerealis TaxID=610337 RepID=A0ACC2UWJ1_9TREE|nr:hypothetical protein QFC19_009091 [Naganishia cerealis]
MSPRAADWTITPLNIDALPTALGPSPSTRSTAVLTHTNRQSSAMPESATLPSPPTVGNSISNTQPLHGFSRSSLASIRGGQENGDARATLGKDFIGMVEPGSMSVQSIVGKSERQISNTYSDRGRNQAVPSNVVDEMGNARRTVRRAQAMGLIKTMPSSLAASPSTISLPESTANSVLSSLTASRNGSFAEAGSSENEVVHQFKEIEVSPISDHTSTPKASLYRMRDPASASISTARKVSPFRQVYGYDLNREMPERSPALRSGSFGSPSSPADQMSLHDGGMVASTGWLITVVPPDSLFYALNQETTSAGSALPGRVNDDIAQPTAQNDSPASEFSTDGLDKVLSTARLKKWRKGKLMPLVSDLKGMTKAIGREWNLPSDAGMEVFLSSGRKTSRGNRKNGCEEEDRFSEGEGTSDTEEETDGLLGEETWRMVWAEYIAEAEMKRTRAIRTLAPRLHPSHSTPDLSRHKGSDSSKIHEATQRQDRIVASAESLAESKSVAEASPTMTEPPSTGNTFGRASQPSNGSLQDVIKGNGTEDLPQIIHVAEKGQQDQPHDGNSDNTSFAYHQGALTPATSQTAFPNGVHSNSFKKAPLIPAAQAMLSPSPSSVFPGGSVSQQASPLSVHHSDDGHSLRGMTQPRRVLGKIEFDFDSSTGNRGEWYARWLKRKVEGRNAVGEHRNRSWSEEGGVLHGLKPLHLLTRPVGYAESMASDDGSDEADSQHADLEDSKAEYAPLMDEADDDETGEEGGDSTLQQSPVLLSNANSERTTPTHPVDDPAAHESDMEIADAELDHLVSNALTEAFPDGPDDFVQAFTAGHPTRNPDSGDVALGTVYNWKDIGSQRILDERVELDQLGGATSAELEMKADDTEEVRQMLADVASNNGVPDTMLLVASAPGSQGLLASPIELPSATRSSGQVDLMTSIRRAASQDQFAQSEEPVHGLGMGIQMNDQEKRGSALVISSQLDALEKGASAPFASGAMPPMDGLLEPSPAMNDRALQRFSDSTQQSVPETTISVELPANPDFPDTVDMKTPAPISEASFQQGPSGHTIPRPPVYTPRSAPEGVSPIPLSLETMMRMEYETQAAALPKKSPGWKPQRPARPPSPHLELYTAPSPHLKLSDTPPPASMTVIDTRGLGKSPDQPDTMVEARPRVTSGSSKGINKLNKLFHRRVSEKADTIEASMNPVSGTPDTLPDFGVSGKSPKTNDSFGRRFFKGLHVKSPSVVQDAFPSTPTPSTAVTIISDPIVVSTTNKQAYQLSQLQEQQASPHPSAHRRH